MHVVSFASLCIELLWILCMYNIFDYNILYVAFLVLASVVYLATVSVVSLATVSV